MSLLIDKYGRMHDYLRISLTDRCNFNCIYCKPACHKQWMERENILTYEELLRSAKIFAELGIKKIRLTGGEPLIRKDVEDFVAQLLEITGIKRVGLTTNGFFLKEKSAALRSAGLQGLNISLDTLKRERFLFISKHNGLSKVLKGIDEALKQNFPGIKINMVVMKGINEDELTDFMDYFGDKNVEIRFIEYMPFGDNGWSFEKYISSDEIRKRVEEKYKLFPIVNYEKSGVAVRCEAEGLKARIGFISSNSHPFCASCSRLRLTSDGKLRLCLYAKNDYDLKSVLRSNVSDEEVAGFILSSVYRKESGHGSLEELQNEKQLVMTEIGG